MSRLGSVSRCAVLIALISNTLHAAASVRTVALSGQLAPGGGGATFSSFNSSIELLAGGRGAFSAKLSIGPGGVTTNSDSGIWSEKDGALNLVVREGEAAPGTPAGALLGELSVGRWNSSGSIAFETVLQTGTGGVTSSNDTGVWANVGSGLQLIAREGSPAPGTPSGVVFGDSFLGPELNESGVLALTGSLKTGSGGVTVDNNEGIWLMRGGPLGLLVREGQQSPGGPAGAILGGSNLDLTNLSYPEVDAAGYVSFNGHMVVGTGGVTGSTDTGFWSERSGNLELTYREGMQAPGAVSGVKFFSFGGFPYTNANGRYSDQHTLTGGDVSGVFENGRGIYNDASGELKEIARGGQPAPGTAAGTLFGFLSPPSFNDAGQSSFFGNLRNAANSIPTTANEGIWSDSRGTLELIVREGDAAPGIDSGAVVGPIDLHAYRPTLNNAGQSAFPLKLLQGVGGVTAGNDTGYWAQDATGTLRLIVREGDLLTVAPGDARTIASFGLNGDARGFRFDDLGNLMFRANFTDGSQGLFIATAPVPEPNSYAILLLTVVFTCAVYRQRMPSASSRDVSFPRPRLRRLGTLASCVGKKVAITTTTSMVEARCLRVCSAPPEKRPAPEDKRCFLALALLFPTAAHAALGDEYAKLTPNDASPEDQFGNSVGMSGNMAIIGAYGDDDNGTYSGSAYLFDVAFGSQLAKLTPDDGAADDYLG